MRILYVAYSEYDLSDGIFKKILSQCSAFQFYGNEIYIAYLSGKSCVLSKFDKYDLNNIKETTLRVKGNKILDKINKQNLFLDFISENIKTLSIDCVYMRKMPLRKKLIKTLEYIKSKQIKIICEIPTFPYIQEMINNKKYVQVLVERKNWNKFYHTVDKIPAVLHNKDKHYKKIIPINNAIDIDMIPISYEKNESEFIDIIGVGYIYYYHGFDRIIKGISNYIKSGKVNIRFHIVGDGPEIPRLKDITNKLGINNNIIFYGKKSGEELDEILNKSHIGVGAIGIHRKDATIDTSLKIREYCARGIPFIVSGDVEDIDDNFKFIKKVSQDDKPVDMNDIEAFYNDINQYNYKSIMRKYAQEKLTWKYSLFNVVKEIES